MKDENIIKMYWNMNYVSSCVSTQRAGVIILYDNSYECIETYTDNGGRIAIAVVKGEIEKLIVVNVYVPCDPVIALEFMGTVYDKIYELMDKHEDAFLIIGGDFNACMIPNEDSINIK